MEFSRAQYEAVIAEIEAGTKTLEAKLAEVKPAAKNATSHWWIDPVSAEAINYIADKTVEIGTGILNWILDVLKGATAPIWMFVDAYHWMDLRGTANAVSTDLSTQNLVIDDSDWRGKARDNYLAAAGAQAGAAARVGSIAGSTAGMLATCAGAGLAFYIAVAAVLAKLIATTVAAVAALGSVVFSWVGAGLVLQEAGFSTTALWAASATLAGFLGTQAAAMITMHGDTVDPTSFPNGVWPKPNSAQYNDATVFDANGKVDADWSLKKD
ncbi:hypothetical protein Acy02nite_24230 [Actinoplanes cyaneus]|uniref:Uncharacterized protein n=1 Tax=Actinoplanes cyaneus TaxID=52696 RepID=A0A919IFP5_9ACTN|nr:hypothetical protein [Actinoplanes cyaneus]MCW2136312.1 hypothetical protein [Actinoplanes cyaneus]GID64542.1 hypothetical protein Acy02nite_24230 [Actinoplanes cyaneus]